MEKKLKKLSTKGKKFLIICSSCIVIFLGWYGYSCSKYVSTDNARIKIANVKVVADVSGYIAKIYYANNAAVKTNATILEIEKDRYEFEYAKALADLEYTTKEYERKLQLQSGSFIAEETLTKIKHENDLAKVAYKKAAYELEQTKLLAKTDGIITNFELKIGDFVNKGMTLFNIIDNRELWVEANFKESDITNIKVGQNAEIEIDAFPENKWIAKVVSITPAVGSEFSLLPAQNFSGNWIKISQRIMVKLQLVSEENISKLASGMSAEVRIKIR